MKISYIYESFVLAKSYMGYFRGIRFIKDPYPALPSVKSDIECPFQSFRPPLDSFSSLGAFGCLYVKIRTFQKREQRLYKYLFAYLKILNNESDFVHCNRRNF